jgi:hypothetical protein
MAGLIKLGNLRGMGLRDMVSLIKLDMLKLEDLIEYDLRPVQKIWEREKPKYLLEKPA